jgi:hypothetical protein
MQKFFLSCRQDNLTHFAAQLYRRLFKTSRNALYNTLSGTTKIPPHTARVQRYFSDEPGTGSSDPMSVKLVC